MLFTHSFPQSAPHPPLRNLQGSSLVIRLGTWGMGCGYIVGGCRGRWVNIWLEVFVFFCIGILDLCLWFIWVGGIFRSYEVKVVMIGVATVELLDGEVVVVAGLLKFGLDSSDFSKFVF